MKNITIYCASSPDIHPEYFDSCKQLAKNVAQMGHTISYGGGAVGLMGTLADKILANNGKIKGVIPDFMIEREWQHPGVKDMQIVNSMHERKAQMLKDCDIAIALPGGCGTFEEFMEALTWKRLDIFHGQLYLLNIRNYYDPLIAMLNNSVSEGFMAENTKDMWIACNSTDELLEQLESPVYTERA